MSRPEYLVGYGVSGEFGRFAADTDLECQPGDRVVIRSRRGVEIGTVLCPATAGHLLALAAQPVRPILRRLTPADEAVQDQLDRLAERAFAEAQALVACLGLPVAVLDVEALADPRLLVVHYLGGTDYRDLVHRLSTTFDCLVEMSPWDLVPDTPLAPREASCCGSCQDGSCAGGGCGQRSCGTCASRSCTSRRVPGTADGYSRHYTALGQRG
jgi:hypothetical protein